MRRGVGALAAALMTGGLLWATPLPAAEETNHEFVKAVLEDDTAKVARLLEEGFDPNREFRIPGGNKLVPLEHAIRHGRTEVVEMLLEAGAEVERQGPRPGRPFLDFAADEGHAEIVKLLVARGAKLPFCRASRGTEALAAAEEVEILNRWAYIPARQLGRYDCTTMLHATLPLFDPDLIRELVALGAEPDVAGDIGVDRREKTPLEYAAGARQIDIVRLLGELGADPNTPVDGIGSLFSKTIFSGQSEIKQEMIRTLLELGVDPQFVDARGCSNLGYACRWASLDVVSALLEAGGDMYRPLPECSEFSSCINALLQYAPDDIVAAALTTAGSFDGRPDGARSLVEAARLGRLDVVEMLLEMGAEVTLQDHEGMTPLMAAAKGHRIELVELLLAYGADPWTADAQGWTALHHAVAPFLGGPKREQPTGNRVLDLLLRAGGPIDARDRDGRTPLLLSTERQGFGLKKLLVAGADPTIPDAAGRTALHGAAAKRSGVRMLIYAGADPDAQDEEGVTPMMRAASEGHLDAMMDLRDVGASWRTEDARGETAPEKYWRSRIRGDKAARVEIPELGVQFAAPGFYRADASGDWAPDGHRYIHYEHSWTGAKIGVVVAGLERKEDLWMAVVRTTGVGDPTEAYAAPPVNLELSRASLAHGPPGREVIRAEVLRNLNRYVAYATEIEEGRGGQVRVAVAGGPAFAEPEVDALLSFVLEDLETSAYDDGASKIAASDPAAGEWGSPAIGWALVLLLAGSSVVVLVLKQRRKPRMYVSEEFR